MDLVQMVARGSQLGAGDDKVGRASAKAVVDHV